MPEVGEPVGRNSRRPVPSPTLYSSPANGSVVAGIGLSGAIPCGASTRTAGFAIDGASLDATLGGGGDGGNGG